MVSILVVICFLQEPTSRLFSSPGDPVSFRGQILRNIHGKRSAYELSDAPSLTIHAVLDTYNIFGS
jgi:hypothetical protein